MFVVNYPLTKNVLNEHIALKAKLLEKSTDQFRFRTSGGCFVFFFFFLSLRHCERVEEEQQNEYAQTFYFQLSKLQQQYESRVVVVL